MGAERQSEAAGLGARTHAAASLPAVALLNRLHQGPARGGMDCVKQGPRGIPPWRRRQRAAAAVGGVARLVAAAGESQAAALGSLAESRRQVEARAAPKRGEEGDEVRQGGAGRHPDRQEPRLGFSYGRVCFGGPPGRVAGAHFCRSELAVCRRGAPPCEVRVQGRALVFGRPRWRGRVAGSPQLGRPSTTTRGHAGRHRPVVGRRWSARGDINRGGAGRRHVQAKRGGVQQVPAGDQALAGVVAQQLRGPRDRGGAGEAGKA
mmetsp:Transcript_80726/g.234123  ORF Transcript_80726/g.234123 Transcript_80726/m.234123 type:complete len:263 (-) Transcript_80726:534-1322(-)